MNRDKWDDYNLEGIMTRAGAVYERGVSPEGRLLAEKKVKKATRSGKL